MKYYLSGVVFGLALLVGGCALFQGATGLSPADQALISCEAYDTAASTTLNLAKAGKLSPSQIATMKAIDAKVTPICLSTDISAAASVAIGQEIAQMILLSKV